MSRSGKRVSGGPPSASPAEHAHAPFSLFLKLCILERGRTPFLGSLDFDCEFEYHEALFRFLGRPSLFSLSVWFCLFPSQPQPRLSFSTRCRRALHSFHSTIYTLNELLAVSLFIRFAKSSIVRQTSPVALQQDPTCSLRSSSLPWWPSCPRSMRPVSREAPAPVQAPAPAHRPLRASRSRPTRPAL